jgi:hypothetical protein
MKYIILSIFIFLTIFISCTEKDPIEEINPDDNIEKEYENYSFNLFFNPSPLLTDIQNPVQLILTDKSNSILLDTVLQRGIVNTINYKSTEEKVNLTYIFQGSGAAYIISYYDFSPKDWAIPFTVGFAYPHKKSTLVENTEKSTVKLIHKPGGQTDLVLTGSSGYEVISSGIESIINYKRRVGGEYLFLASGQDKTFFLTKITSSDTIISLENMQNLSKINYRFNVNYPLELYGGSIIAYPEKQDVSRSIMVFEKFNYLYDKNEIYCPVSSAFEVYHTSLSFIDDNRNEHSFYLSADSVPTQFDLINKSDIILTSKSISSININFNKIKPSYYSTLFKNDSVNVYQYLPTEMNSYSPDSLISVIKNSSFIRKENFNNLSLKEVSVEIIDSLDYQEFISRINSFKTDNIQEFTSIRRLFLKY